MEKKMLTYIHFSITASCKIASLFFLQCFVSRYFCKRPIIKYQSDNLAVWAFILNITHKLFLKEMHVHTCLETNYLCIWLRDPQEARFTRSVWRGSLQWFSWQIMFLCNSAVDFVEIIKGNI